jgi:hypothetical protein
LAIRLSLRLIAANIAYDLLCIGLQLGRQLPTKRLSAPEVPEVSGFVCTSALSPQIAD